MVRKGKDPWLHLQQVIHFVKNLRHMESVKENEKSGISKAAAKFVVQGKSY